METTLEILRFLQQYLSINTWGPTYEEIAQNCSLAGGSSVIRHIDKLEAQGYIERTPQRTRCIKLTEKGKRFEC